MIKVAKVESTLRGESPKSGIPTVVLEIDEKGKGQKIEDLAAIVSQGIGEVVTITGKPFRQLKALIELINTIGNKNIIVETSGRLGTDIVIGRSELIPLVDKTTLVIKPNNDHLDEQNYIWMRNYRFSNSYYKFEWQGSDEDTLAHINKFFNITNISQVKMIRESRIIIVSSDPDDKNQGRDIWTFCLINELRYSGRENRRLFK